MNPSFGINVSDWVLSIIGSLAVFIVSAVINRLYKRIESLEASLPKRMEQYHQDQAQHRDRFDKTLEQLRNTLNAHAVQLSALESRLRK